jgi:hypothetical protein
MSFTVTVPMVEQYNANVLMLSQQKDTRLQRACAMADVVGKSFYAERVGSTEMYERTSRHADVHYVGVPHTRRKGTVHDMEWPELIDRADTPKVLIDINGKYVQSAVAAANRAKDSRIIAALGGAAHGGEAGATTINNYDSGECRLVDSEGTIVTAGSDHTDRTATYLTAAKVLICKTLLDQAEVDASRRRFIVTNATNINALLADTTYGSEEWKTVRDIADGKMRVFQGFEFIQMEYRATGTGLLYDTTDAECLACYAFAEGAVTLGVGQDIQTVVERVAVKNADQVLCTLSIGAERNEGPAVVEINLKAA